MPDYQMRKFRGEENETLLAHLCFGNRVEFHTPTGAVLTREEFEKMVAWVSAEFDKLAAPPRVVH